MMGFSQSVIAAAYFAFGGLLLFLAYTIINDNPRQRLNRLTALMLFFAAVGPIFLALGTLIKPNVEAGAPFEESLIYNFYYIWEMFFPAFLLFAMVFPVDRLSQLKRQRLKYLIFLPHLFHLLLVIVLRNPENILNYLEVDPGEGLMSIIIEPLSYVLKWLVLAFSLLLSSEESLFAIINLIYVIIAGYFIIRGWTMIGSSQARRETSMIVFGITAAVVVFSLTYILPAIFSIDVSGTMQTILTILALLLGGGAISWSIIRYQFLNVRVIVRQSLVYTITSGILVGLYILLISQADRIITAYFGGQTTIINIAFIVAALILFQPINSRLDNLIKRLFMTTQADYRHVLEDLSRRLVSVFDPPQIRHIIEQTLRQAIMVEKLYFVLYDDSLEEYALLPADDYPDRYIIDRKDLFLGGVNQLESPTNMDRLALYREDSPLGKKLESRRAEMILPLKDANHLLGFLALTGKSTGYRYNAEDTMLLGVMSNQLVTVLTNARLYADSLEKHRMDEELAMARKIQLNLLPKEPPTGDNFQICTYTGRRVRSEATSSTLSVSTTAVSAW